MGLIYEHRFAVLIIFTVKEPSEKWKHSIQSLFFQIMYFSTDLRIILLIYVATDIFSLFSCPDSSIPTLVSVVRVTLKA